MNVWNRLIALPLRRFFVTGILAFLLVYATAALIGIGNEAAALHGDITPECPDTEWGAISADMNGASEQYVKFSPGQTTFSVSSTGQVSGQCTIVAFPTPSSQVCEVIVDEIPHLTSVGIHRKKTFERDRWVYAGGIGGPSGNLGGFASASVNLTAGTYWLRGISSAWDTTCNVLDPNSATSGVIKVHVNKAPPKEEFCPTPGSGDNKFFGNPCDASNGNKSQQEVDYASSIHGMGITRTYNSKVNRDYGLGVGWTAGFLKRVDIGLNMIRVRRPNGSSEALVVDNGVLVAGVDGTIDVTQDASGYSVTLPNGSSETYDLSGRILTEETNGYTLTYTYNASGELQTVQNLYGHQLSFTYDADGHIDTITTPGNTIYQYAYDTESNLESVTMPDSSVRQYHYEDSSFPNALTGITDENGDRFSTYAYDSKGFATSTEYATTSNGQPQEKFQLSYNIFQTQTTVTDPVGNQLRLDFQRNLGVGRLKKLTNLADGKYFSQTFDSRDNRLSRTDENGHKTTYTYNLDNQKTTMTEAFETTEARTTNYTYLSTSVDLVTSVQRPSVWPSGIYQIMTSYDTNRNPDVVTQSGYRPDGTAVSRTTDFDYNTNGQLTQIDGPRTDVTDTTGFDYYVCATGDECGQLKTVTNALGHVTTYNTYDAHGRVTRITDANGLIIDYTYNDRGQATSIVQTPTTGPTRTTLYTYDDLGQVLTVTTPGGSILTYFYDKAHDLRSVTDNFGNKIEYSYDLKGNRTADTTKDSSGNITRTVATAYDIRNRIDTINAAGSIADLVYDAVGNLTDETDPNLNSTGHSYDALDRVNQTIDALTGSTSYSYDVNDQLIGVVAANGASTSYTYDDLGNQLSVVSPDTGTAISTHDAAGNVLTRTDARNITTTYTYDALNRPATIIYPDTSLDVTLTYDTGTDQKGRLTSMVDAAGVVTYTHDQYGNITEESRTVDGVTYSTSYSYDGDNQVTQMTYPSGRTVDYTRDILGRITAVDTDYGTSSQAVASSATYESFGPLSGLTLGNGLVLSRSFDQQYRLTAQTTGSVQDISLTLDAAGNIDLLTDNNDSSLDQDFAYDALNRLSQDIGSYGSKDFTYDGIGNRFTRTHNDGSTTVTQTLTYLANTNRLDTRDGSSVSLDVVGNTLSDPVLDLSFDYGDQNRMVKSYDNGVLQATYTYSGNGQRLKKVEATGNQRTFVFHYGLNGELIGETVYDSASSKIEERDYLWLDTQPLAQAERTFSGGSKSGSSFVYLHVDHLNTPRLATDSSQDVVWRWDSDAFGIGVADTDPDGDTSPTNVRLRFPGQYIDDETQLHYNYHRTYDPSTGRYLESDPIGLEGGLNTYVYVYSNPLSYSDETGLYACRCLNTNFGQRDPKTELKMCAYRCTCECDDGTTVNISFVVGHSGASARCSGRGNLGENRGFNMNTSFDRFNPFDGDWSVARKAHPLIKKACNGCDS